MTGRAARRAGPPGSQGRPPGIWRSPAAARLRDTAAAGLLAALIIAWAAVPAAGARPGTRITIIIAVISAIASLGRLATADAQVGGHAFDTLPVRAAAQAIMATKFLPWSEILIVAVLVLEALHQHGAWHAGVLGVAVLAYLFAVHLGESGTRLRALAPQLPVLAAGLGVLVLAVAAAVLPQLTGGPGELLRVLAVTAAVVAAALALPVTRR
ncbi:MAG TPA: hypothetical protein VFV41_00330 [Streptosporangiaceae bacterium]|nr:hypothetical protein [Streptosporangiaceae bacterium]